MTGTPAPTLSTEIVREYAKELVEKASTSRVLAIRGNPNASYPEVVEVAGGRSVRIRPCISSLAVRAALVDTADGDYLMIITDRPREDIGETLLAQFRDQRVQLADTWHSVARLFGASRVSRDLRQTGTAVADALLRHAASAYPAAPSGVVTLNHAMGPLASAVLGIAADELTPVGLMKWTQAQQGRNRWRSEDQAVREAIANWIATEVGSVGFLSLAVGGSPGAVDAIVVGLACDVLWPAEAGAGFYGTSASKAPAEAMAARARLERFVGDRALDPVEARQFADTARGFVLRMALANDIARGALTRQVEVLVTTDLHWPEGAESSTLLPLGYTARLHRLSDAIDEAVTGVDPSVAISNVEVGLADLLTHESARTDFGSETERAEMAVRIVRWFAQKDGPVPGSLADALSRQMATDAWVDRAVADVSAGSSDEHVAAAYGLLCATALTKRQVNDLQFAKLLVDATLRESDATGVLLIEDILDSVVKPLADAEKLLLIVVDGMSASVAAELADGALARGWREAVPAGGEQRRGALAVLPTLTTHSRTSLLTGKLTSGTQVDEKSAFPQVTGGPIFHKGDLQAGMGQALATAVRDAVTGSATVVGVVLNTVDDTLAKHDPDGTDWTIQNVQYLGPLLEVAAAVGRTVVLTSDHGHVVERGGPSHPVAGAANRWRPADSGPVREDEVLVTGRRVLAGDGTIIVPAVEQLRYASRTAGYHGGATPAEAVVPIVVLVRDPEMLPDGWALAPAQAPSWWYEPATGAADTSNKKAEPSKRRKAQTPPKQDEALFDVSIAEPAGDVSRASLAVQLVASDVYRRQHSKVGRAALRDEAVVAVVSTLVSNGGRADRDAVAGAAGVGPARFNQAMSMLRRILNVESYEVISIDADQHTVLLDEVLLRTQFGLGDQ